MKYLGLPDGAVVRNPPIKQETWVQSFHQEDHLEKEMAAHSSILAWEISWTEEPGGQQSMGSQIVGHDLMTKIQQWNICFTRQSRFLTENWISRWKFMMVEIQRSWVWGLVFLDNTLVVIWEIDRQGQFWDYHRYPDGLTTGWTRARKNGKGKLGETVRRSWLIGFADWYQPRWLERWRSQQKENWIELLFIGQGMELGFRYVVIL